MGTTEQTFSVVERDPAAVRIREAAARGTLSHALLLTGGGDLAALSAYAAAAMECTGPRPPCGVCPHCRKAAKGIHPDIVTVRDEQHKNIAADLVRNVRLDACIRPNEGARKVYIFPDCALLTERDQNILLKTVEEGPPFASFVFCAENSAAVLPTLRSRCVELKPRPRQTEETTETPPEHGEELCRRVVRRFRGKQGAVAELAVKIEKQKLSREELAALLNWCREAFAAGLVYACGGTPGAAFGDLPAHLAENLTGKQMMKVCEILRKSGGDCASPVGTGHLLGGLAAELEELA